MLEAVSDDAAPAMPDTALPEVKVRPADNIFGFAAAKDAGGSQKLSPPQGAAPMEIKLQPADAILGAVPPSVPPKDIENASAAKGVGFFGRFLRFCARTAAVALLCAIAWAAGAYYSDGHPALFHSTFFQGQQSPTHDEMASTVRQMAEDIRALKASVDGKAAAQSANAVAPGSTESQANSQAIGRATSDVDGRIDKLDSELTSRLSKVDDRLASIEQRISTARPTVTSGARPVHKRPHHFHDAFDPSKDPAAPGVPRPLGAAAR